MEAVRQVERRRHPRAEMRFSVEMELGDTRLVRTGANLSLGGAGFVHPLFLAPGTRLWMNLLLDGGSVRLQGEVLGEGPADEDPGRVRFVRPDPFAHMALTKCLYEHFKQCRIRKGADETAAEGVMLLQPPFVGAFSVGGASVVIGRERTDADVLIPHPSISKRHAYVFARGGHHVIDDLDSTNGIFHEGRRVDRLALRHGTVFQLGDVVIEYLVVSTCAGRH